MYSKLHSASRIGSAPAGRETSPLSEAREYSTSVALPIVITEGAGTEPWVVKVAGASFASELLALETARRRW